MPGSMPFPTQTDKDEFVALYDDKTVLLSIPDDLPYV